MPRSEPSALITALTEYQVTLLPTPPYYPRSVELALIDAVLSIRARYGTRADTGVRAAVRRYQEASGRDSWNDLRVLAGQDPQKLEATLDNKQKTSGVPKSAAIVSAAAALTAAGVAHAEDVDPAAAAQKRAYTGVRGLGPVTWEYFLMCVGHDGVKADTLVTRFVTEAISRPASPDEVASIVSDAAAELDIEARALDHSIWRHMTATRVD